MAKAIFVQGHYKDIVPGGGRTKESPWVMDALLELQKQPPNTPGCVLAETRKDAQRKQSAILMHRRRVLKLGNLRTSRCKNTDDDGYKVWFWFEQEE